MQTSHLVVSRKTAITTLFVLGVILVISLIGPNLVTGAENKAISTSIDGVSCSLGNYGNAPANRIVVNLTLSGTDQDYMVSGNDGIQRYNGNYSVVSAPSALIPGQYDVYLQSYDSHSTHGGQGQLHEQFYVNTRIGASVGTGQTGISTDIPEYSNQWIGFVGRMTLTGNPDNMYAVHAYPNDTSSPNSLTGVCVAFDPVVSTPTPPPATYDLTIQKKVQKINPDGGFSELVDIAPNEVVQF